MMRSSSVEERKSTPQVASGDSTPSTRPKCETTFSWCTRIPATAPAIERPWIRSPAFSCSCGKACWNIRIYPEGYDKDHELQIGMFLELQSGNTSALVLCERKKAKTSYWFRATTLDGHLLAGRDDAIRDKTLNSGGFWGYPDWISRHLVLPTELIFLKCFLEHDMDRSAGGEISSARYSHVTTSEEIPAEFADKRAREFYKQGHYTDLSLISDDNDESVPCHSLILACYSPVVEAFIQKHDCSEESQSKSIRLPFSAEVLKTMLRYVYEHKFSVSESLILDLLSLGDYLGMEDLKRACETSIIGDELSAEKVIKFGIASLKSNCSFLQQCCIEMGVHLMETGQWLRYVSKPEVVALIEVKSNQPYFLDFLREITNQYLKTLSGSNKPAPLEAEEKVDVDSDS